MTTKDTVVFLDVDGVINHLYDLRAGVIKDIREGRRDNTNWHLANGFWVNIPDYVIDMVQYLHEIADIHWLTTWRDNANEYISPIVGLPIDLPVISDRVGYSRYTDWKAPAAAPIARELLAEGKRVLWIEDFYGRIPKAAFEDEMEFIDTGAEEGLFPFHLDDELLPEHLRGLGRQDFPEAKKRSLRFS
jgi:hypothetical protein